MLGSEWCGHSREGPTYTSAGTNADKYIKVGSDDILKKIVDHVMVKFGTRAIVEKLLHHGSTNLNESSHNTQNSITPGGKRSNMAQAGVYTTCMFNAASSTNLENSYRQRIVEKLNLHVPHSMKVVDKWLDGERRTKTLTRRRG